MNLSAIAHPFFGRKSRIKRLRNPMQKQSGFTLLEVMIAFGIFALLAAAAFMSLQGFIDTRNRVEAHDMQLAKVQKAMWIIANDLKHIVARDIRDAYGTKVYALTNQHEGFELEFTRVGWKNIGGFKARSELQRVAYKVGEYDPDGKGKKSTEESKPKDKILGGEDSQQLMRYYWTVLDQAEDSEPKIQLLVDDISSFEVRFVDIYPGEETELLESWPKDPQDADFDKPFHKDRLPVAIEIKIESATYGSFRRFFQLSDFQEPNEEESTDGQATNTKNSGNKDKNENKGNKGKKGVIDTGDGGGISPDNSNPNINDPNAQ